MVFCIQEICDNFFRIHIQIRFLISLLKSVPFQLKPAVIVFRYCPKPFLRESYLIWDKILPLIKAADNSIDLF